MKSASERLTRKTLSGFVMGHDEIADGIENFDPMPVGLIHAGEQAGIFQAHRRMTRDRLQNLFIAIGKRLSPSLEAENANQFTRGPHQTHQG